MCKTVRPLSGQGTNVSCFIPLGAVGARFLSVHNDDYSWAVEWAPTQGPSLKIMTKSKVKQTWQEVKCMVMKNYRTFNSSDYVFALNKCNKRTEKTHAFKYAS